MKLDGFKKWLEEKYPETPTTVSNRIANCKNVEKYYGDLDEVYRKNMCESLVKDLSYTTLDERNNNVQKHLIPIDGNIRNGSATLKQSVNLYISFIEEQQELLIDDVTIQEPIASLSESEGGKLFSQILQHLKDFKYKSSEHKDISVLQIQITDHLAEKFTNFTWQNEYKPASEMKDRIDIFGTSLDTPVKIVIELDAHRADQVAKKFLSRTALMIDHNILYFTVCYPGTDKMPKAECIKYFEYCKTISKSLSENSHKEKLFGGLMIN